MSQRRELVAAFGRCSRLLSGITPQIKDKFFSELCAKEADNLLSAFIVFLRGEEADVAQAGILQQAIAKSGDTARHDGHIVQPKILQQPVVVKSDNIVQRTEYVAQYYLRLISQIKNILNLLDVLKHLGLAKPPTSLLLEKSLLLLELSVLNTRRPSALPPDEAEKPIVLKIKKNNPHPSPKLGQAHKEILEFVKGKERVQNSEVFAQFAHISRRTLKRKLSELARANGVRRIAAGKKVFYSLPTEN